MASEKPSIVLRVSPELKQDIQDYAKSLNISMSAAMSIAISEMLKRQKEGA
jgi:predicted transcriptional regulator